jgi:Domain of unknown function (DUF4314)
MIWNISPSDLVLPDRNRGKGNPMNEAYQFAKGDYVELVRTTDPHTRLKPGDRGTVRRLNHVLNEAHVQWDSGSNLIMLLGEGDRIRLVEK